MTGGANSGTTMYADTAYAPFGESYAQAGASDLSFTGMNQDSVGGDYDILYREYSIQGRWLSPDPGGLAAVDPMNPQSWNRYAYVLNNPLNLLDPNGLDCAYLNDSGTGVQSIDHYSLDIGECEQNGGYWANGWIANSSWVSTSPFNDNVLIYSQFDNGGIGVSLASQTWTQGAFGLSDEASNSLFSSQQWTPLTYDQQAIRAIHNTLSRFPTVCGNVGIFASVERNGGGFFGSIDSNGKAAIQPIVGGERIAVTSDSNNQVQLMLFGQVTGATGVLLEPNMQDPFKTPNAVGGYAGTEFGPPKFQTGAALGIYVENPKVAGAYQCKD